MKFQEKMCSQARLVSAVLLFLLIIASGTQFARLALANPIVPPELPHIYVRSDGSVEPSTAPIQRVGDVYTFTGDVVNCTVEVQRDNVVVDGAGYTLQGPDQVGIDLTNRSGVTIKNLVVKGFTWGITIENCVNNTLTENKIVNTHMGIRMEDSSNNLINENEITDNYTGIRLRNSPENNIITRNSITGNEMGIEISLYNLDPGSSKNSIYGNNFIDNNLQAHLMGPLNENWDNTNSLGGNYWSDYNGADNNDNGIGDTAYVIDETNQDNYPLMNPKEIPEFPSWTILPLTMAVALFALAARIRSRLPQSEA